MCVCVCVCVCCVCVCVCLCVFLSVKKIPCFCSPPPCIHLVCGCFLLGAILESVDHSLILEPRQGVGREGKGGGRAEVKFFKPTL